MREGSSYVEAGRSGPDAVAGRADDAGLVDMAGADEACRAGLAQHDRRSWALFQIGMSGDRRRVPRVNIGCGKLEISS